MASRFNIICQSFTAPVGHLAGRIDRPVPMVAPVWPPCLPTHPIRRWLQPGSHIERSGGWNRCLGMRGGQVVDGGYARPEALDRSPAFVAALTHPPIPAMGLLVARGDFTDRSDEARPC